MKKVGNIYDKLFYKKLTQLNSYKYHYSNRMRYHKFLGRNQIDTGLGKDQRETSEAHFGGDGAVYQRRATTMIHRYLPRSMHTYIHIGHHRIII